MNKETFAVRMKDLGRLCNHFIVEEEKIGAYWNALKDIPDYLQAIFERIPRKCGQFFPSSGVFFEIYAEIMAEKNAITSPIDAELYLLKDEICGRTTPAQVKAMSSLAYHMDVSPDDIKAFCNDWKLSRDKFPTIKEFRGFCLTAQAKNRSIQGMHCDKCGGSGFALGRNTGFNDAHYEDQEVLFRCTCPAGQNAYGLSQIHSKNWTGFELISKHPVAGYLTI